LEALQVKKYFNLLCAALARFGDLVELFIVDLSRQHLLQKQEIDRNKCTPWRE
jgi:hypothetical protein